MRRFLLAAALSVSLPAFAFANVIGERAGWKVHETEHSFAELVERVNNAVKANEMGLVTRASASVGAEKAGITIPGNMVIGVYRNDFARRMLSANIAAGIEAPIRIYVTEEADGTATLSYKTPTTVFSPYFEEGGDALEVLAGELDTIFASIAEEAVGE